MNASPSSTAMRRASAKTCSRPWRCSSGSLPGLPPGPQPVCEARRLLVVGGDRIEALHRRGVGVDGRIVEDRLVDEFLTRQVAVGIGEEIGVLRRDLGAQEIV